MDLTEKKKSEIIDDIDVYFGCKYLTSSELLSLQIRDPSFRLQLSSQLLFYINFLRSFSFCFVLFCYILDVVNFLYYVFCIVCVCVCL